MALRAVWCVLLLFLVSASYAAPGAGVTGEAILGGWNPVDPESKEVQDAAKKAVQEYNMKANTPNYFRLIQVLSAQSQVTSELNYKITAIIGETKCSKSQHEDPEKCELGEKRMQCDFHVTYSFLFVEPRVKMSCRPINVSLSD
ncbi:hypothetical protein ACEWY4_004312 [Coilia grayii]|uniref:Cystatin domain-containing protein n=1 Tax=Coilia grayii TaxID=363190 RepID=A0ABD1KM88_9TELE